MKLFNKYQSRALQFALDLLSQLQSAALSSSQVQALAQQWGLDYADQVIQPLCRAGFLEQTADGYRLTAEGALPRLPLSAAERSTLAALLQIPESQLFLEPALWERLAALCAGTPAPPVRPAVCPCRGTPSPASGAGGLPHPAQSRSAALADSLYLLLPGPPDHPPAGRSPALEAGIQRL